MHPWDREASEIFWNSPARSARLWRNLAESPVNLVITRTDMLVFPPLCPEVFVSGNAFGKKRQRGKVSPTRCAAPMIPRMRQTLTQSSDGGNMADVGEGSLC